METYKSPLEQSNGMQDINPFNKWKVSDERGSVTPSSFFKRSNGEFKRLVNMSPNDYYKFVSHQIGTTPEKLMEQRSKTPNQLSIEQMRDMMRRGVKFDTPWLRLDDVGEPGTTSPYWQEGLHRMLAAGQEYGMDTKFPIYIAYENDPWDNIEKMNMDDFLKHYDDTRLARYNKRKEAEAEQERKWADMDRRYAAVHFKVSEDQVTPEMIKEYQKWEANLFSEDVMEELLKDINEK